MASRIVDLLIDRIETDDYPSVPMMDVVERLADREQRARYVQVVAAKIADEQFPSPPMIARLLRLGI